MPVYDTTFVLNPQLEEAGLDGRIKEVVDLIGANGGKMVREQRIGMRRLAYEIQKLTQGYYVSLIYEGNGDLVREMERRFRLDESCLRFLTCLHKEAPPKPVDSRPSKNADAPAPSPVKEEAPAEEAEKKPEAAETTDTDEEKGE
jgi:small subunit ribosomal protein S6